MEIICQTLSGYAATSSSLSRTNDAKSLVRGILV